MQNPLRHARKCWRTLPKLKHNSENTLGNPIRGAVLPRVRRSRASVFNPPHSGQKLRSVLDKNEYPKLDSRLCLQATARPPHLQNLFSPGIFFAPYFLDDFWNSFFFDFIGFWTPPGDPQIHQKSIKIDVGRRLFACIDFGIDFYHFF